jgi:hypothetical protein
MVNSTFLLNYQEYQNRFGNYIQPGSKVSPSSYFSPMSGAFELIEPFIYGGKTYVHYFSNYLNEGITWENNIAGARELARLANGTLYTPSNDDEFVAIYNWKASLTSRTSQEWSEKYQFCEEYTLCHIWLSSGFNVGLIRLNDGTWIWDDSDDQYAFGLIEDQYFWNPVGGRRREGKNPIHTKLTMKSLHE